MRHSFGTTSRRPKNAKRAEGKRVAQALWVGNDAGMATALLFVEDDDQIRLTLGLNLEDEGYTVFGATTGTEGLETARTETIDIAIVDLLLPDVHGFEVVRGIREHSRIPIVILTAQADTHDVVAGLEAGADDYLVKPIAPKELAARLRALLRRVHGQVGGSETDETPSDQLRELIVGPLLLRPTAGEAFWQDQPLVLTKTEFKILCELAEHPGELLSREVLLDRVWGYDYLGDGRLVDTQIYRLRVKLEANPSTPQHLVTVRGLGYKLVP
jgi:two-component system, OmpR family, response regulator RegX3